MNNVTDSLCVVEYSATSDPVTEAYDMGFDLGSQGIPACPSIWYGPAEAAAFDRGHDAGFDAWRASLYAPRAGGAL